MDASLVLLDQALDRCAGVDWDSAGAGEVSTAMVELTRMARRLEALQAGVLLAAERSGDVARDGYRTTSGWYGDKTRTGMGRAKYQLGLAKRVAGIPSVAAAWCAGDLGAEAASMLADARKGREKAFDTDVELLVGKATTLAPEDLATALGLWRDLADPDAADDERNLRAEKRGVHASPTLDRMVRVDGWLEGAGGTEFLTELARLTELELATDWAAARAEHGDRATVAHLARTPAQRRADALVAMARRSAGAPTAGGGVGARWIVNVLCDQATLEAEIVARATGQAPVYPATRISQMLDGTVLTPSEVLDIALRGEVRRVLVDQQSHKLNLGRASRLFTGGLRQALLVRDRHCREPGCRTRGERCQGDHIVEWEDHGITADDNGELKCGPSNRHKHRLKVLRRRGLSTIRPQPHATNPTTDALQQWRK